MNPESLNSNIEHDPEGALSQHLDVIAKRNEDVGRAIGARLDSVERMTTKGLSSEQQKSFAARAFAAFTKAKDSLIVANSAATVAHCMAAPAQVSQTSTEKITGIAEALIAVVRAKAEATGVDIEPIVNPATSVEGRVDSTLNVLIKPPLLGSIIGKRIPGLMVIKDIYDIKEEIIARGKRAESQETLQDSTNEHDKSVDPIGQPKDLNGDGTSVGKLQQRIKVLENGDETVGKKVDSAIQIATDTPILSKILKKRAPYLSFIQAANDLMKDVNDPSKSKTGVEKNLGRFILDARTFGLGSFVIGILAGPLAELEKPITKDENPAKEVTLNT
jgi:hypothetical protein